ncbi:hypothetical protein ACFY2R_21225 [Micromonospora olivasterospora]|uniref:Thioesterase superfamily protein n=1 Tax=Micromonospora olivasterospora TaxID=1880 RepID=A0A562I5W4_MICOL|nr:hypothetical protein [Micromonospora olivasterospora]TWH66352.1 hypothetical protein JD77_01304 [Micromonospora olivasterospora]
MIIPARFNGPPGSGNGGWSAGAFATATGGHRGVVEVTLRQPPPLETPLTVAPGEVRDPDGLLIAQVRAVDEDPEAVPPVDVETARTASAAYPGLVDHPFPGCYVCGPDRADGLRIFPGRLADGRTAAAFTAPAEVDPATVWAALDCPGGWAVIAPGRPYVLGRMAAVVDALPAPGDECVVTGVAVGGEGRKALVRTSLYGPDGRLLGRARATWIALPGA